MFARLPSRPTRHPLASAALALLAACTPLVGSVRGDGGPDAAAHTDAGCAFPDTGLRSGARDPSWPAGAFALPPGVVGFLQRGALLDARGRIYVYGNMTGCLPGDPTDSLAVVRHRADGSLDTGFGDGGHACFAGPTPRTPVDQFLGGAVDAEGRVYLVGQSGERPLTEAVAVRLAEDGSLDPDFNGGRVLALRPALPAGVRSSGEFAAVRVVAGDGVFYVTGTDWLSLAFVVRLRTDGSVDAAFGAAPGAVEVGVQGWMGVARAGGATLVAGHRVSDGALVVRRLLAGGAFDPRFGVEGYAVALAGQFAHPRGLAALPGGAVVSVASSGDPDINLARATAVRFTPEGALDEGFADAGVYLSSRNLNHFYDLGVLATSCDGRVLMTSHFVSPALGRYAYVERLDPRGQLDRGFSSVGAVLGAQHDHGPGAVLVDPASQWIYLVTRSNRNTGYAIERFAP